MSRTTNTKASRTKALRDLHEDVMVLEMLIGEQPQPKVRLGLLRLKSIIDDWIRVLEK